ncbi:MAG: hypothetical protein ACI9QD_000324 [Thermoproteota archaeon]|jgi:hypothetical protein
MKLGNKRIIKTLLLLCLITSFSNASAYMIGMGTYVPYAFTAQEEASGGTNYFEINPAITIAMQIPSFFGHFFTPEFGYVMHRNTYDDVDKSTMFLLGNFAIKYSATLLLRYGLGLFMEKQSGSGGGIVLNNGAGTSTFYKPESSVTTYINTLNLGVEYFVTPRNSFRFDLGLMSFMEHQFKFKNYILTYNFYL